MLEFACEFPASFKTNRGLIKPTPSLSLFYIFVLLFSIFLVHTFLSFSLLLSPQVLLCFVDYFIICVCFLALFSFSMNTKSTPLARLNMKPEILQLMGENIVENLQQCDKFLPNFRFFSEMKFCNLLV